MKKLKKRVVFCILLMMMLLSLSSCGKKEKSDADATDEYYTKRGFTRGTDGYYYLESDPDAYYDDMLNRYEIGDTESGYDDILFNFIKSVSALDFKAAINFTETDKSSTIVNTFMNDITNSGMQSEIDQSMDSESVETDTALFSKDLYKDFLLSIEAGSIQDTVYCEGYNIVTMNIKHKDFTNLDFWKEDYDMIMSDLYDIYENSNDYDDIQLRSTDYIVKYIQDSYRNNPDIEKKESRVEFTLVQNNMGSWSVRSDEGLFDLAMKNNGRYVYEDIEKSFEKYKDNLEQEKLMGSSGNKKDKSANNDEY